MLDSTFFYFALITSQIAIAAAPLSQTSRVYVGELQERWKFPSDHLPIGISIQDATSSFRVISWNVLNSAYMKWIYDNSQGLARSDLTKEDIPIKEGGLTLREQHVIDLLLNMIRSPNILCLQECSEVFIQELQLPPHMKIVRSSDTAVKNQNLILYDARLFGFIEKNLHMNAFPSEPNRPLMEVLLEKNGVRYRIFNAHLRCDSARQQRFELALFIHSRKQKEEVTLVLGDLNVDQTQMEEAFQCNESTSFLSFSPYKTTISPELHSKTIDHIFIDLGVNSLTVRETSANELLEGLQNLVDLLNAEDTIDI